MREIERKMLTALNNGATFKSGNTEVLYKAMTRCGQLPTGNHFLVVELYGNEIARKDSGTGEIEITSAGWETATTKSRLVALGADLVQQNFQWYLNGKIWNGEWTPIK